MGKLNLFLTLCALLALLLAACKPVTAPAPLTATATAPAATATPAPATTNTPAEAPPTSTPSPESTSGPVPLSTLKEPDDCLVGTWEVSDMSGYVLSMLPIEMQLGEGIKFEGITGSLRYTFDNDFNVTLRADAYTFSYTLKVSEAEPLSLQVILDGSSSGSATWVGDSLCFAEGATDDLKVTMIVAGKVMVGETKVANLLPLGTAEQICDSYECAGNTLRILPRGPTALPITLERANP